MFSSQVIAPKARPKRGNIRVRSAGGGLFHVEAFTNRKGVVSKTEIASSLTNLDAANSHATGAQNRFEDHAVHVLRIIE